MYAYSLRGLELMAKLGFVVSEFNRDITYQMELLGREHAQFLGAEVTAVIYVPGVYDMPIVAKKATSSRGHRCGRDNWLCDPGGDCP